MDDKETPESFTLFVVQQVTVLPLSLSYVYVPYSSLSLCRVFTGLLMHNAPDDTQFVSSPLVSFHLLFGPCRRPPSEWG